MRPAASWTVLLEAVVQVYILRDMELTQEARLPRAIQQLYIDPAKISPDTGRRGDAGIAER